ncbi:MAG: hypothetical protein IKA65_00730 [Lentisphaeria bacterium]|nr:hypothetical protein [Lentisphaeria bacterium]
MKKMDIENLVRKQDWLRTPAGRDWRDGMLLGNGDLGSMASAPDGLEWIINKTDIFDPTVETAMLDKRLPHHLVMEHIKKQTCKNSLFLYDAENAPHKGLCHRETISAACLRMRFWGGIGWAAPALPKVSSHLELFDGMLTETLESSGIYAAVHSFIPRDTHALCIRITGSTQPHFLTLSRIENSQLPPPQWHQQGEIRGFTQTLPGGQHEYAVAICMQNDRDAVWGEALGNGLKMSQSGDADCFVVVRSSLECASPWQEACREILALKKCGWAKLCEKHQAWWHNYWQKSYADFGRESEIQRYYTFSLYEVASSFAQAPMPGLNGLGFGPLDAQTPGVYAQGYTHDQNAQIPALAMMPINRIELIHALTGTYLKVMETLRKQTRQLFGTAGICLPLAMNQLGMEYPTRAYRYTLCGSAYTGFVLSQAWQYSQDIALLKEHIYPLLREFVIFYTGLMQPGEDGVYHLDWSVPPEIFRFTRDETATLALLKPCLKTAIEASELLHTDHEKRQTWQNIFDNYPEFAKTPQGALWLGPDIPLDHYFFGGHLWYPFYPCAVVTDPETIRKTADLIEKQCVERSYTDPEEGMHYNHEWSEYLNTSAALWRGEREKGWQGIYRFLRLFAKENGLFAHDPIIIGDVKKAEHNAEKYAHRLQNGRIFCDGKILTEDNPEIPHPHCVTDNPEAKKAAPPVLEGSSSFLLLTAHALVQCFDGIVRLFPGVPDDFTGAFENYLVQGGFAVSAEMINGKVSGYCIRAQVGGWLRWVDPVTGEQRKQKLAAGECVKES